MKIVSGRFRGRLLETPKGRDVRPTGARAREAVFNILANGKPGIDLQGLTVLDAFAGTGALGFEALSRGAAEALFLDRSLDSLTLIRRNASKLGILDACTMLRLDTTKLGPMPRTAAAANIAFLDPPYGQGLVEPALRGLARFGWLTPDATVVVETQAKYDLITGPGYTPIDVRDYGAARVHFLQRTGD